MDNYKLELCDSAADYTLIWEANGESGAFVGDSFSTRDMERAMGLILASPRLGSLEDWECAKADHLAKQTKGAYLVSGVIYWERKADAMAARVLIRRALKEGRPEAPEPSWADEARALGWTPPKAKKKA